MQRRTHPFIQRGGCDGRQRIVSSITRDDEDLCPDDITTCPGIVGIVKRLESYKVVAAEVEVVGLALLLSWLQAEVYLTFLLLLVDDNGELGASTTSASRVKGGCMQRLTPWIHPSLT